MAGLTEALAIARKHRSDRTSTWCCSPSRQRYPVRRLVADVIIEARTERILFGRSGHIASVADRSRRSIALCRTIS
jgi:hypothetical protein